MHIRNRWFLLLAALLSFTLVLAAACGGDDDDDGDGGATGGEPTAGATTSTGGNGDTGEFQYVLTEAPDDAAPPEDQKLTVNLRGEPDTIDPQASPFGNSITINHLLFAGLLTYDDKLNLMPLVATEVPSQANGGISGDGLKYTFKLRDDVMWTDGQPVTASDFEYAIKRLFDPNIAGYYASFYTDITGAAALLEAEEPTAEQVTGLKAAIGVSAPDATTLEVTLDAPVATFLQRMALHAVYPVRQDIVEANPDDWTEPGNIVSNGPFKLREWAHGDHITLEANADFFLGGPVLQEITLIMQEDTNVALAAYEGDDISTTQVPPAAVAQTRSTRADELREGNTLQTFAIIFNNAEPPFDDVNVRKAFAAALDREAYVVGVRQGDGVPSITWLPDGIPGHDPEVGIAFDAEQAKAYLAASEQYPNGEGMPALRYMTADDTANSLTAEYVKAQIQDNLGLDVEIEVVESAAFEERFGNSDFQMSYVAWAADYADPDNWIPAQFHSEGTINLFNYANPEVDALIDRAARELDNDERIALYEQAQQIIFEEDAAIAPLFVSAVFHLVKPNVQGWKLHPLDAQIPGDYTYPLVYISE